MSKNSAVAVFLAIAAMFSWPALAQNVHLGVKSCGSSGCHGQVASDSSPVLLNEYITWQKYDKHARAYQVLLEPRSARIVKNLGLKNAHEADICLDCHADNVPEAQRGPQFVLADGVGCEACHGAGSAPWMGLHIGGSPHEANVKNGLRPLEDPVVRANLCLDCHLGNSNQYATHRIMGAGHPRISFEVDSFTDFQPAHFVIDDDYRKRKHVTNGMQIWAIGQALSVARRMDLMLDAKYAGNGVFPELAFFDCHSCHHPMSESLPDANGDFPVAWRPRPGTGVGPGEVKLNDSNMQMLEVAVSIADAGMAKKLAGEIRAMHKAARTSRAALVDAARQVKATAEAAAAALGAMKAGPAEMKKAASMLTSKAAAGQFPDYETAEQATMALGAFIEAMRVAGAVDAAGYEKLSQQLEAVYASVDDDEAFVPGAFAAAMKSMGGAF